MWTIKSIKVASQILYGPVEKKYVVKFMPKASKDDKVRPLALASCMLKFIERLLEECVE